MKIIHQDYKKGVIKVKVDDNEDLWTLRKVITEGDKVSGSTTRVIKKEDREGIRKKVFIKLNVEKAEFMQSTFVLKVLGKIIEGPDDVPIGSYHSFNIKPGVEIKIEKESWGTYEKKVLAKSEKKPIRTLITIIDSREATQTLLTSNVKELYTHHARLPRKDQPDYDKKTRDYYLEVIKQIKDSLKNHKASKLVIAGPGFAPEELMKVAKEQKINAFKAHTNHTGMAGVKELIKTGIIDQIIAESEVSEETRVVDNFFEQVSKDKLIKYGLEDVKEAVNTGSVKTLLVSEGLITDFRERKRFKEIEDIINMAEQMKTKIEFISTKHDAGRQFHKFNGIGAILRY